MWTELCKYKHMSKEFLSNLVHHRTYAKYLPEHQRRETKYETITRNLEMHCKRFPHLREEITKAYDPVYKEMAIPAMRALEDSTPIRTDIGWSIVGEIKTGDMIFDSIGEPTCVEKVLKFDNVDLYDVCFSDGSKLTSCDEHLWVVASADDRLSGKTRIVTTKHIKEHLTQGKVNNFCIYNPKPIKLPHKELFIDPYIMGLWLGDGYSPEYQYSSSVEDSSFFSEQYKNAGYEGIQSKSTNIWTWTCRGLSTDLCKYDLINNKHIPQEYLNGSIEQRLSLLQGLIDSDGCIDKNGKVHFSNTNKKMISGIVELISSLGIKYTQEDIKPKSENHKPSHIIRFTSGLEISRLPRKKENIRKDILKQTEHRKIISVDFVKKGSATCFVVSSPDRTFLAGREMIVTHNCMQFSGEPIERRQNRAFNCTFLNITKFVDMADLFYQSMSGAGVGYSVKQRHISQLPIISDGINTEKFVIPDSAEGWSNSLIKLLENPDIQFDYSQIRLMGEPLSTGGTASGPKSLIHMHSNIRQILRKSIGKQLTSFETHRICCLISDCVVVGGVRRCLLGTDDVLTDRGCVKLRDVKNGDMVLTHKNRFQKVVSKVNNGSRNLLEIKTNIGSFFSTENHKWITATDLYGGVSEKLANELGVEDTLVFNKTKIEGTETQMPSSLEYTPPELTEDTAWFVGYFLGNGSCSVRKRADNANLDCKFRIAAPKNYPKIIEKIQNIFPLFIKTISLYERKKVVEFTTSRGNIAKWGLENLKQPNSPIKIPTWIMQAREEIRMAFIAGILDSDGTVRNETTEDGIGTGQVAIVSTKYENFAKELQSLISLSGIPTRRLVKHREQKSDEHIIKSISSSFRNILVEKISDYSIKIAHDYVVTKKSRESSGLSFLKNLASKHGEKYNLWNNNPHISYEIMQEKQAVDFIPVNILGVLKTNMEEEVFDIEVEEDHSFFINGILTHNSATIVLFDPEDTVMLNCKSGKWWEKYPELARANNSAVVNRADPQSEEKARMIIDACFAGGQAEPGLVWTNHDDAGLNPCAEISFSGSVGGFGVCNLTEVNASTCLSKEDWLKAVETATIIGTLQASYTNFSYIQPEWKKNAEQESLLGVSITGQAENIAILTPENLQEGAKLAVEINKKWAEKIGINPAKRITCVKPSGTASSWLGTTAGIHAGHAIKYLRRVRLDKESKLGKALQRYFPNFIVPDTFKEGDIIIQIPISMYETTLLRTQETSIQLLERMKNVYDNWILPGHVEGDNTHNVSLTVSYHEHEKNNIKEWMIENRESYIGISLIPFDGGDYAYLPYSQPPHPEVFDILEKSFKQCEKNFKFENIKEKKDMTEHKNEAACAGGACLLD